MPAQSIFADEWRECLRAHYSYVQRLDDKVTERTLRGVMLEVGFTEAELRELTVLATMRVEDVADDFVPDMDILAAVYRPGSRRARSGSPGGGRRNSRSRHGRARDRRRGKPRKKFRRSEDDSSPQQMSLF